jgi:exodeoxyribonuclease VII small subunit
MDIEKLSYEEALAALQQIAQALEEASLPVNLLAEKAQTASLLVQHCRGILRQVETDLSQVLEQ